VFGGNGTIILTAEQVGSFTNHRYKNYFAGGCIGSNGWENYRCITYTGFVSI